MQLCHTSAATSAVFDDPNLVSSAGLVPVISLATAAGLRELAQQHLSVPTDKGANAGLKVTSLVAGMVAGADSIDDMALLRHGGMGRIFGNAYAPSTLGSFLRSFTFGHVRQLDAVASRLLINLGDQTPLLRVDDRVDDEVGGRVMVDIDDTIIEVHGYAKQGSSYGYSGVRGLNALLATVSTTQSAPVVVAQRLRKGSCGSPRGAARLVADTLKTVRSLTSAAPLVRFDSAFYGHATVAAALRSGADVSVTVRMDPKVKAAITTISEDAWTPIAYTDAVFDEQSRTWVSRAEVAEIPFTAFSSKKASEQVPGRLVVRRIPDLNADKLAAAGQETLFDVWRFHAFFTTTDHDLADTVVADKTHRGHAIIEQVHADLKNSALAHLPSGKFTANAAWLVLAVMAFNLTRTAASITGPALAKATTATIRRKLIAVPARVASSARRITLHLPVAWPWETAWTNLFNQACGPPPAPTT
ncbi:IS1380 family transposase [Nocardioides sp. ChNu-99]|uniref:IS1380 family transposase n=1 Tax=Nocardioides sp. ChNu-99 TaxID=2839897 RepID=UPI00240616DC|nr:IS1380 family transposase [Nocardioides sp. ChNu-99]MDF9717887.1 IS1380 family transposase [Nocardioides sp. ChNu-99]